MSRLHARFPLALLTAAAFAPAANAAIDLIAIGSLDGRLEDRALQSAAPLENGVPGNRMGGMGSGIAWAGGTSFLMLPDRGPNANAWNSAVDDTTSYVPRFHEVNMSLSPADAGSALPFTLTPFVLESRLLSSPTALTYAAGAAPALNTVDRFFFNSRSDNFDPALPSMNPANGRLDPEGIRVTANGRHVFISDEYGPYVYKFDRASGTRTHAFALPAKFAAANLSSQGATEESGNTSGRVANRGMEGLAITPSGGKLVGIMQSPLLQDGGKAGGYVRVVTINTKDGSIREYAYPLTNTGTAEKPKYGSVSEILAINETDFLVIERDGKGRGDNSSAVQKMLYRFSLAGAKSVAAIEGEAALASRAVTKQPVMDLVAKLGTYGITPALVPAKIEGLAFGADVSVGGTPRHTLWIVNDNDYMHQVNGVENPNNMFVFAFDDADLPGYVPQSITLQAVDCR